MSKIVEIDYTNHRGERGRRTIQPRRVVFESTEWHTERQWLLCAWDLDRKAERAFAMKDIHGWKAAEQPPNETSERLMTGS